jgi:hypothetical protein
MAAMSRIFVGSSSEALELAEVVGHVIQQAGLTPILWNSGAFRPGRTLLEEIESFPREVQGAVLLATPDLRCIRGDEEFWAPAPNLLFEYGYLGGRLTRDRVAICRIDDAEMPSDAHGVKLIESTRSDLCGTEPPRGFVAELTNWLSGLCTLAPGIPPTVQLHGYSGKWEVHNSFSMWRGLSLNGPDQVHFDGTAYLTIPLTGKGGRGVIYGASYIALSGYQARHYNVNEVLVATVSANGVLELLIEVRQRILTFEQGHPPDQRLRDELRDKRFNVSLTPDPDKVGVLRGRHTYRQGLRLFNFADEEYTHEY